jgi:light-regulated signal transduction histidine kinase (bacteriophytochrome)
VIFQSTKHRLFSHVFRKYNSKSSEHALKYSSPLRTAKIHFQSHINDEIALIVSDNGLGIDLKEHGKEIFGFNKVFHKHPTAKGVGLFSLKPKLKEWVDDNRREYR